MKTFPDPRVQQIISLLNEDDEWSHLRARELHADLLKRGRRPDPVVGAVEVRDVTLWDFVVIGAFAFAASLIIAVFGAVFIYFVVEGFKRLFA